jgi:hypothetical protein
MRITVGFIAPFHSDDWRGVALPPIDNVSARLHLATGFQGY